MATMKLFRRSRSRLVIKTFGRDSLLVWLNPFLSALQAAVGFRIGFRSDADLLQKMEEDALDMAKDGYRVVSTDRYDLPLLGIPTQTAYYYRVTYELTGGIQKQE
jgi:hypothetical protein